MDPHSSVTEHDHDHVRALLNQLFAALDKLLGAPKPAAGTRPHITESEQQFLRLLCHPKGYRLKEIAHITGRSVSTLRTYQERIAERHGIKGQAALGAWAVRNGLV